MSFHAIVDLVRATDRDEVFQLVLLDLNSAFGPVGHAVDLSFRIIRPRFSVKDTVLECFISYL
jgi:hypothetical protein